MRTRPALVRPSRAVLVAALMTCLGVSSTAQAPGTRGATSSVRSDTVARATTSSARAWPGSREAVEPAPGALPTEGSTVGAFPAVRPVIGPTGSEVAEGELLVVVSPGRAADVAASLAGALPVLALRPSPDGGAIRIRLDEGVALAAALEIARGIEGVLDATPNAILRGTDQRRGRGQARQILWNVDAMHLPAGALGRRARATHVVALLDSGVAHQRSPGLAGVEIVTPWDAIDADTDPQDENGHGTFLANLLVGAPGLARGAALMPVRVLDGELVGTEAALVEGLAHARAEGADVVNLSLVYDARYLPTRLLDAAIAETLASGVVIVAAAGNDGAAQVRYPAAFPGVVAVGASTLASRGSLERAHYSSHGAALDVLAPGGDLDADRNGDGLSDGIVAESFDPRSPDEFGPWLYAGTSQAAAHASAAVLHVLAAGGDPTRMPAQLRETARGGRFHPETGGGMLDASAALARHVVTERVGAQSLLVLRDLGNGVRGVAAPIALLDADGAPVVGARVHGRFRGAVETTAECTSRRDGTCVLEASPLAGPAVVALEIEAVVLRRGAAVRPATLVTHGERDAALSAVGGVGFGSSSMVWVVDPSWLSLSFAQRSFLVYGSGEGSALAPTVVAFDDAIAATLGGDDRRSYELLAWEPGSFLGTSLVAGGGFGSSSITWSGWGFTWTGWGSPIYGPVGAFSMYGAQLARVSVR